MLKTKQNAFADIENLYIKMHTLKMIITINDYYLKCT